jgi:chaperone required for assembly of F1-ATPase
MIGRRRFWKRVSVVPQDDGGYGVFLDAKPLTTPERRPLTVPTEALAEAIAAEWEAVEGEIRPEALPFTRAANSALDRVAADPEPVVEALAAYGDTDLVCYRASDPAELQAREAALWDPWLDWARRELGAPLMAVTGVMHQPQPPASIAALKQAVAGHDAFALTALHDLVALSGSLVLGLAISRGALGGETAWSLSRLDETWQAEQWGRDHEAELAASVKCAAFLRAETLLALLRGHD